MSLAISAAALAFAMPHGIGGGYPGIPYRYSGHVPSHVRLLAQIEASVQAGSEEASTYRLVACRQTGQRRWSCTAHLIFVDESRTAERCRLPISIALKGRWYRSDASVDYSSCSLFSRSRLFAHDYTRKRPQDDGTTR